MDGLMKRYLMRSTRLPPYIVIMRTEPTALSYKGAVIWMFHNG